ncbi:MAG: hypothetical protein ACRDVG_07760, partial [Jatrophihabitantaceae bacterium]
MALDSARSRRRFLRAAQPYSPADTEETCIDRLALAWRSQALLDAGGHRAAALRTAEAPGALQARRAARFVAPDGYRLNLDACPRTVRKSTADDLQHDALGLPQDSYGTPLLALADETGDPRTRRVAEQMLRASVQSDAVRRENDELMRQRSLPNAGDADSGPVGSDMLGGPSDDAFIVAARQRGLAMQAAAVAKLRSAEMNLPPWSVPIDGYAVA